jgi:hypothetical protein
MGDVGPVGLEQRGFGAGRVILVGQADRREQRRTEPVVEILR